MPKRGGALKLSKNMKRVLMAVLAVVAVVLVVLLVRHLNRERFYYYFDQTPPPLAVTNTPLDVTPSPNEIKGEYTPGATAKPEFGAGRMTGLSDEGPINYEDENTTMMFKGLKNNSHPPKFFFFKRKYQTL